MKLSKDFVNKAVTFMFMAIYGLTVFSILLCLFTTFRLIEENLEAFKFFGSSLLILFTLYIALTHSNGHLGRGG